MAADAEPLATEDRFFAALVGANVEVLDEVLAPDFLIVDVMRGAEVERAVFIGAFAEGQLAFDAITPAERRVRRYGGTAIVNGRTSMSGRFGGSRFAAASRYTHVFVAMDDGWRLVSAQGTQIAE